MSTTRLFDQDAYLGEFEATVERSVCEGGMYRVLLDQTAFFPEGGGQPADEGTLDGIFVTDVQEIDGEIWHTVEAPLEPGKTVVGKLDFEKRFSNMQNHCGEHIVSGIVHRIYGFNNVGFHMGSDVITVDFDGVLSELSTKSVDLGMAGLSPDPKRADIMDFSDLYYMGGQSLVTTKANAEKFNSFEAVNKPEVSVGAQTGSIQMDLAQTNSPDADIVALPKVTDIISELLTGKMDAAYIETDVAVSYQKNYPELELVLEVPYESEGSAIGVCKDNESLLKAVNASIAKALEDGTMEKFIAEANEQASGEKYEGLLDAEGNIQQ